MHSISVNDTDEEETLEILARKVQNFDEVRGLANTFSSSMRKRSDCLRYQMPNQIKNDTMGSQTSL